jgi:hypothetical protein
VSEWLWNFVILTLGLMPGWGIALYNLHNIRAITFTVIAAAVAGVIGYSFLVAYGRNLFLFYSSIYIISVFILRNIGAGLLITSAVVGFWELPAQLYRYLGWWDAKEFSGWMWCIYSIAIVTALIILAKPPLEKIIIPIVGSTIVNAMVLILYPTLIPYADNIWYLCRGLTSLSLIWMVNRYGRK